MDTIRFRLPLSRLLRLFAAFAALMLAVPALAQTTGQLTVTVRDADDTEVPNAAVTLSGEALMGGAQTKTTGASGMVKFDQLVPTNTYQVYIEHDTAGSAKATNIPIAVNRNYSLVVKLNEIETVVADVKEKAVDTESTSRSTVLTKDFLTRVPSGRNYQSATQMAAGVQVGSGGNPNIGGAASNENTYMLDGANITDPVTGTFSVNFNFDAIQQIEVLLGGYMPEYGVSLGGVVNVVTESGSNNLKFNSSVYYTNGDWRPRMDERLSSDGFTIAPTGFESTFQTINLNALVSGPVVRDKAFFILSYSHERSLIAIAGTPQRRDYEGHYVYGKLTVQPSSEHRFTAAVQVDPTTVDNTYQGDPWIKAEAQGRQAQGGIVGNTRWQWFLSPDANLDTAFVFQKSYIEQSGVPCTHDRNQDKHPCRVGEAEGNIDWENPGRDGAFGAYDTVNNILFDFDDRLRFALSSKLELVSVEDPLGGTHDFKFGVEGTQLIWDRTFGVNGNIIYTDLNEVAFDPETFENYYWVEYSKPFKYRTTGSTFNFFLQDSWKPVSNLTINYGTRFDNSVMRNDIGEPVLAANMWGPRLFAAWDPWGDQKTKVATGYGRFNDTGRLAVADFTSRSGLGSKLYFGEFLARDGGVGFLNNQDSVFAYNPNENLNTAHDNIRNPRTDEVILILEREVVTDFALSSSMSGKFTRNLFDFDETSIIYNEDGSQTLGSRVGDIATNRFRIRTPSVAKRDVFQWDLSARKIMARRWAMVATYTFFNSYGTNNAALQGSFANDPQTQYNYGRLLTDQTHAGRVITIWDLPTDPWTQRIGLIFLGGSGFPQERFYENGNVSGSAIRIRNRNAYTRLPFFWDLSIRFTQEFDVRKGKFALSAEARNITNNRAGDFLNLNQLYTENRFIYTSRQNPFRLQLGATYEF